MDRAAVRLAPAAVQVDLAANGAPTRLLSDTGGLKHYGCHIETLLPGAQSSRRHWHSAEGEFLLVLQGGATVVDDDGAHCLGPLDAAAWPYGVPNGHHVRNLSNAPVTYVTLGSRVAGDICSYPDSGDQQINGMTHWRVVDATGAVSRGGALPPHLLGLPGNWGIGAGPSVQRILPAATRIWQADGDTAHAVLGEGLGTLRCANLGNAGGLSQFGVHLEELLPGSASSFRHWREVEDEMLLVLAGPVVLVEDSETVLGPGDVVCWPAGAAIGHCLVNRSAGVVRYLVIGTRLQKVGIHYPDHDLIDEKDGSARVWLHGDGQVRA